GGPGGRGPGAAAGWGGGGGAGGGDGGGGPRAPAVSAGRGRSRPRRGILWVVEVADEGDDEERRHRTDPGGRRPAAGRDGPRVLERKGANGGPGRGGHTGNRGGAGRLLHRRGGRHDDRLQR